jgi:hypothetical protein
MVILKNKLLIFMHWLLMLVAIFCDLFIIFHSIIVGDTTIENQQLIIIFTLPILIFLILLRIKKKIWVIFPWQH